MGARVRGLQRGVAKAKGKARYVWCTVSLMPCTDEYRKAPILRECLAHFVNLRACVIIKLNKSAKSSSLASALGHTYHLSRSPLIAHLPSSAHWTVPRHRARLPSSLHRYDSPLRMYLTIINHTGSLARLTRLPDF